jgi:hypothetical protein
MRARAFLSILIFSITQVALAETDMDNDKVAALLQKVEQEKSDCQRPAENQNRPAACRSKKMLLAMEALLKSYISLQTKSDNLKSKNNFLITENKNLKHELEDPRNPASYIETPDCFKRGILKKLMIDEGIPENGSALFVKKPAPLGKGNCWSNGKKKTEATITLCDYPLAINIETRGGLEKSQITRQREYLFSLNGCDLMSIHITDQDRNKKTETFIAYDECAKQWNKRTADAAMTKEQVKRMQDTIGVCFRENLLPPRESKNGRDNPNLPRIPASKSSASEISDQHN